MLSTRAKRPRKDQKMVTISLTPGAVRPRIFISRGDVGRVVSFKIDDTVSGYTVKLICENGEEIPVTVSGTNASFSVTSDLSAEAGMLKCKLQMTSGDDVISSQMFYVIVED